MNVYFLRRNLYISMNTVKLHVICQITKRELKTIE